MAETRWHQVKEILADALELSGKARSSFVATACGLDMELRSEVEKHLGYEGEVTCQTADATSQMVTCPAEPSPRSFAGVRPERWVGPYRLVGDEPLGKSGMGIVFKAERREPYRETVALKRIKPGFDTTEVIARFNSERQALARMNHPNIAKVLDAGSDNIDRPYFVMEYIPGVPITKFADDHKLTVTRRLDLFTQVCDAVAHAHTKAIIHRDIKASNVLACMADGKPVVKVIDFGIAKALTGDRLTDLTFDTQPGQAIGTYESMSPEQADGSPDIDTRTDVYSLGVLLYELLTGAKPFDCETFGKANDPEIRRIIREVEPPRPSNRLSSLGDVGSKVAAASRRAELGTLTRQLRSELEWIPMMAMRKERDRRYASPLALSADIRNYLEKRPLTAGPDSLGYTTRKFITRHKGALSAAAAIVLLLVAGITVSTQQVLRALAAERDLKTNLTTVSEQRNQLIETQRNVERNLAQSLIAEADYRGQSNQPAAARQRYLQAFEILSKLGLSQTPVRARLLNMLDDESPLMGAYASNSGVGGFAGHSDDVDAVAVSLDGRRAITASEDKTLRLWSLLTGELICEFSGEQGHRDRVTFVTFAPGEQTVLSASNDGTIKRWDVATGRVLQTWHSTVNGGVWVVACSPDGSTFLSGGEAKSSAKEKTGLFTDMELWDLSRPGEDRPVRIFHGHTGAVAGIAFTRDGRSVISASHDGSIKFWDVETGRCDASREFKGHRGEVNCIAIAPDGILAASASFDGSVQLWDVATGNAFGKPMIRHTDRVWRVQFSPDGRFLASASRDGTVRLWNVKTQEQLEPLYNAGDGGVMGVAFLPDSTGIVSTRGRPSGEGLSVDQSALALWRIDPQRGLQEARAMRRSIISAAISDDRTVLLGSADGQVELWDPATSKAFWTRANRAGIRTVRLSGDGRRALSGTSDGLVLLWDVLTGELLRTWRGHSGAVNSVAFLPDNTRAISCGDDGTLRIWDPTNAVSVACISGNAGPLTTFSLSRDGRQAMTACKSGEVRLWNLSNLLDPKWTPIDVKSDAPTWSENGLDILYTPLDHTATRFCIADITSAQPREMDGHAVWITAKAFSPDGTLALSGDESGTLILWDIESRAKFKVFDHAHPGSVTSIAFSPNGSCAVSTSVDGTIRVWDLTRAFRQRDLEIRVRAARDMLAQRPASPKALAILGEWYAFRGKWNWATELLKDAQAGGAKISNFTLGQCYWQSGDLALARDAFGKALNQKEGSEFLTKLYLQSTSTTQPALSVEPAPALR